MMAAAPPIWSFYLLLGFSGACILAILLAAWLMCSAAERRSRTAIAQLSRELEGSRAEIARLQSALKASTNAAAEKDAAQSAHDLCDRFFDLHDSAKALLHAALDRHNATAPLPIVISRDGANIAQVTMALPPGAFGANSEQDKQWRLWIAAMLSEGRAVTGDGARLSQELVARLEALRPVGPAPRPSRQDRALRA